MEIAIMIEGADGLTWPRWQRMVRTVEDLGFAGLYRSDHYTLAQPPEKASLELWISLTWLASHTRRIHFGPLVSPISFRDPTMTARMACAVDDLSDGRLTLGLGAGWQEREHRMFGWELRGLPERFQQFEEGLQVITHLTHSDMPVDFQGQYYHLFQAILLPRPQRPGGPSILIGGNGYRYTLPFVAKYAAEWNGVDLSVEEFIRRNRRLDTLLLAVNRNPCEVERSLLFGCVFGRNNTEAEARAKKYIDDRSNRSEFSAQGLLVGTGEQIVGKLEEYVASGLQRAMLRWHDLDDLENLRLLAEGILPRLMG